MVLSGNYLKWKFTESVPIVRWYFALKFRNFKGSVVRQSKSGRGVIYNGSFSKGLSFDVDETLTFESGVCQLCQSIVKSSQDIPASLHFLKLKFGEV